MDFFRKIFGNVLYYPGCMMKFVTKEQNENYKKILRAIGIDFIQLEDLACCGSPVAKAGYEEDFNALAKRNFELLKRHSVKEIISPCPACVHTISGYRELIKEFDIDVKNAIEVIYSRAKLKAKKREKVTFHDPCHLGRYQGIYEIPRKILQRLGYEIIEMQHNRDLSLCCGAGGGFRANFKKLSMAIAKKRIEEAAQTGSKILITSCPLCYYQLKEAGEKEGIEVHEISDILVKEL
jgi:Fe-S oxidoreductase